MYIWRASQPLVSIRCAGVNNVWKLHGKCWQQVYSNPAGWAELLLLKMNILCSQKSLELSIKAVRAVHRL